MLNNFKDFILGMVLVWTPMSTYHIIKINHEIKILKEQKISGWGND
jgi:hypothetical protein